MPITLKAFCAAIQLSLSARLREEREERARVELKRLKREAEEAAWQAELQHREAELKNADVQASKKRAREDQQEQERLEFLAAAIVRQQAKLSRPQ